MKKYISESIGTALLCFLGIGTAVFTYKTAGVIAVAVVFGLTYILCYYTICRKTGCHLNPAVSFAALLCKKIKRNEFWKYFLSQIIGAIVAALLLFVIIALCSDAKSFITSTDGANGFYEYSIIHVTILGGILIETIITFLFVLSYLSNEYNNKKPYSGIIIGITYIVVTAFGFSFTGACINPARGLCSAIFYSFFGTYSLLWMFLIIATANILGAFLAVIAYKFIVKNKVKSNKKSS